MLSKIPQDFTKMALKGEDKPIEVTLSKIKKVSHDSDLFTYDLPDKDLPLGLGVGGHIIVEALIPTKEHPRGELIKRKYTPTSSTHQKGSFDMIIKIYRKGTHCDYPDGGVLSQNLESMKIGDKANDIWSF